jgi:hypothetical protein
VSIQYDCTLTVVPIGTGIYLLCCYMFNTHQSVNPPIRQSANLSNRQTVKLSICQSVKPSICQTVNLSNRQFNLREECPYCDTRTLVGDNPARWFCSTLSYTPLYRFASLATFVRQQSQSGNFPSNGISIPNSNLEILGYRLLHFLRLSRIIQFSAEISMTTKNTFQPRTSELLPNKSSRIASQDPRGNRCLSPI